MHYYKFEIATWHLHTSHLSLIEEAVYWRLINFYYDTETPIPQETQSVIRRLRLGEYSDIVASILIEFFVLQDDGWHQKHCDIKILEYHDTAIRNKNNGKNGGRPKKSNDLPDEKTQSVISGNPDETLIKNKELLTINNELEIKEKKHRATRLPATWEPSESMIEHCKLKRPDLNWHEVAEAFRDYWVSTPKGTKLDWEATWRTWVRNQRAAPANQKLNLVNANQAAALAWLESSNNEIHDIG